MKRTDCIAASTSDVSVRGMIICSPSVGVRSGSLSRKRHECAEMTCLAGDDADSHAACCRIHHGYPCTRSGTR